MLLRVARMQRRGAHPSTPPPAPPPPPQVRDGRCPMSTAHPSVPKWARSKPRLLILNRKDMVPPEDAEAWSAYFAARGMRAQWTNGNAGEGVAAVAAEALRASEALNAKRAVRGLRPRPVRAVVIGFPNVGKSALINRLLGRRAVDSAPKPGVTRNLRWVRVGGDLDLLDAPGIIPPSLRDQRAAARLAMCNDIGEAAYVPSLVAAALLATIKGLPRGRALAARAEERYKMRPGSLWGESWRQGGPLGSSGGAADAAAAPAGPAAQPPPSVNPRPFCATPMALQMATRRSLCTRWATGCSTPSPSARGSVSSRTSGHWRWGACAWSCRRSLRAVPPWAPEQQQQWPRQRLLRSAGGIALQAPLAFALAQSFDQPLHCELLLRSFCIAPAPVCCKSSTVHAQCANDPKCELHVFQGDRQEAAGSHPLVHQMRHSAVTPGTPEISCWKRSLP